MFKTSSSDALELLSFQHLPGRRHHGPHGQPLLPATPRLYKLKSKVHNIDMNGHATSEGYLNSVISYMTMIL